MICCNVGPLKGRGPGNFYLLPPSSVGPPPHNRKFHCNLIYLYLPTVPTVPTVQSVHIVPTVTVLTVPTAPTVSTVPTVLTVPTVPMYLLYLLSYCCIYCIYSTYLHAQCIYCSTYLSIYLSLYINTCVSLENYKQTYSMAIQNEREIKLKHIQYNHSQ